MSSAKRPGTVDYSKWDNLEDSDDEKSDDEEERPPPIPRPIGRPSRDEEEESEESYDDDESSEEGSYDSEESDEPPPPSRRAPPPRARPNPPRRPAPSLSALQAAWGPDAAARAAGVERPCANCNAPDSQYRCSRCGLVRYCGRTCQGRYHAVHKLECIDAKMHRSYWGFFDRENESVKVEISEEKHLENLLARRVSKRRRAMRRAAAAAAVERARQARIQRGQVNKGGGGKGGGKGAEAREETCITCQVEFTVDGDGGVAFQCPGSHYMCNECAGVFSNSVMSDLNTSYPAKCFSCRADYSTAAFERQLTSEQQKTYRAHAARVALKEGEELIECPTCGLFEVVTDDPAFWWCPHCHRGNCRVCHKELPFVFGKAREDKFGLSLLIQNSDHKHCEKLRRAKRQIEEAIEEGSKMRCPNCGLAGRKDDACTHMTCVRCDATWCYVCGLDVETADKAPPRAGREGQVDDIYLHNQDWERNEKRCPMYLTQILEVDLNWLGENWEENAADEDWEDDEKCLDYFHRFRTIKLLQAVRQEIGASEFVSAFVNFEGIRNSGYSIDEIVNTCTDKLIDRSEFLAGEGRAPAPANELVNAFLVQQQAAEEEENVEEEDVGMRAAIALSELTAAEDEQVREVLTATAREAGNN